MYNFVGDKKPSAMKRLQSLCIALLTLSAGSFAANAAAVSDDFVRVSDGRFVVGDSVYEYIGTNFWYGAILGSEGRGGDRRRLARELDLLQANGIDNLRVLVGGDGDENLPSHIMPVLQTAPGVYNDTILDGLDYLMAELERRDMKAVLFLNNAWEWSGGYGTYLEWATGNPTPNPAIDGYDKYMSYVSQFVTNDRAKQLAADHVKNIVTRTNRYTGRPYAESPAIMSWQIANEPRAFADDPATKQAFAQWIAEQAALIRNLDPNHLVSTGSEGQHGCEQDLDLWRQIHADPNIGYAIVHLWPYNWGWVNEQNLVDNVAEACDKADEYIGRHSRLAAEMGKPLVLEEFGYPRDGFAFALDTPTEGRDRFYEHIFSLVADDPVIAGCNFWGWGGTARPAHEQWQAWDDYTGDPAQEAQGLNSVFAGDASTLAVIRNAAAKAKKQPLVSVEPVVTNGWVWDSSMEANLAFTIANLLDRPRQFDINIYGDRKDSPLLLTKSIDVEAKSPQSLYINYVSKFTPVALSEAKLTPGFYRVEVVSEGKPYAKFNIGFRPKQVVSPADEVADLRAFWDGALQELAAVPMNATMVELPEKSSDKRKIYFCQYLSLDNDTVSGYLAMPVAPGKYPAIIYYNGYNGQPWDIDPDGLPEWIEFQHWVRGQGPNKPYNRYDDYIQYRLDDPTHYYYKGAFMDAIRTIDFIASLEQTDTDNIFAEGGSQGGAFTFAAAALDPEGRLRAIAPYIPFLNDYRDYFEIVDWPAAPVRSAAAELGLSEEQMYDNLKYFDIKNLTPWITVPVLMGVGLQDPTCPPHTNFAGYNNLQPEVLKEYVIYPLCGHTVDYTDWNPRRLDFFQKFKRN